MPETANDSILVTLLGTGCPRPLNERFGPSTLIEAGGLRLLFDCGRRITDNLIGQNVTILNHEQNIPNSHKLIIGDMSKVTL